MSRITAEDRAVILHPRRHDLILYSSTARQVSG